MSRHGRPQRINLTSTRSITGTILSLPESLIRQAVFSPDITLCKNLSTFREKTLLISGSAGRHPDSGFAAEPLDHNKRSVQVETRSVVNNPQGKQLIGNFNGYRKRLSLETDPVPDSIGYRFAGDQPDIPDEIISQQRCFDSMTGLLDELGDLPERLQNAGEFEIITFHDSRQKLF
jgi:hypothetical protein